MFHVSGSLSTTTGAAPARRMAEAHEMIVNVGSMTSSPAPRPSAATAAARAAEPLQTAMPCLRPTRAANSCSKRRTNGPSEDIQPVSIHSARYRFSLPSSNGSLIGTAFFIFPAFSEQRLFSAVRHFGCQPDPRAIDTFETRLVLFARVRALLDLDHLQVFQHLESMSSLDQQDDVARFKDAASQIALLVAVEIDTQPPFANEHDF